MKRLLTGLLTILSVSLAAQVTIHRVSNQPGTTAPFADIQTAQDNAQAGDVIIVEAFFESGTAQNDSLRGYAPAKIDKPLTIVGGGYFKGAYQPDALRTNASRVQRLSFTAAATGSEVSGLDIAKIQAGADGMIIDGNRVQHLRVQGANDVLVSRNFIEGGFSGLAALEINVAIGLMVEHNIVVAPNNATGGQEFTIDENAASGPLNNTYQNNCFERGLVHFEAATVKDNIFGECLLQDYSNCIIEFNMFSQGDIFTPFDSAGNTNDGTVFFDPANNNSPNTDLSSIYVDPGGSGVDVDASFQIIVASAAFQTSSNGANLGAFSLLPGTYVPGGIVSGPVITGFDTPPTDRRTCFIPATVSAFAPDGSNIMAIEFFLDNDPGLGLASVVIADMPMDQLQLPFSIPLGNLEGLRTIGVRALSENGNWSETIEITVIKESDNPALNVQDLRAFWDNDPGYGQEPFIFTPPTEDDPTNVSLVDLVIENTGFNPGLHQLNYRGTDVAGNPGVTFSTPVYLFDDPQPEVNIERLLAFFDTDPGYGDETFSFTGSLQNFIELFDANVSFANLTPGPHKLYWRAQDVDGNFSVTYEVPILIQEDQVELTIAGLEYFWDDDPGYGQGTFLDPPSSGLTVWETAFNMGPPAGLQQGTHTVTVRVRDVEGNWSVSVTREVEVLDEIVVYDLNNDGQIGTADLLEVIASFGMATGETFDADLNMDGTIGTGDILALLPFFGLTYP